jgi:hypothetical protein
MVNAAHFSRNLGRMVNNEMAPDSTFARSTPIQHKFMHIRSQQNVPFEMFFTILKDN